MRLKERGKVAKRGTERNAVSRERGKGGKTLSSVRGRSVGGVTRCDERKSEQISVDPETDS